MQDSDDIEIIENTKDARNIYGYRYGASDLELTSTQVNALLSGKCLAYNDGDYSTFISIDI